MATGLKDEENTSIYTYAKIVVTSKDTDTGVSCTSIDSGFLVLKETQENIGAGVGRESSGSGGRRESIGAGRKRTSSGAGEGRESVGAGRRRTSSGSSEERESIGVSGKRTSLGAGRKRKVLVLVG